MKKQLLFPALLAGLCLLLAACSAGSRGQIPPPAADAPLSLAEDETPSYLSCRIVDGAEDGQLLLAALDGCLSGGHESSFNDGLGVFRLSAEDIPVYLDGQPSAAADLQDGMPVEIAFNGILLETFPMQLGQAYSVSAYSIGQEQNPGGSYYDLCGLYLQVLDDLWTTDPGLNEDISIAGLDLSQAPGGLLESEKAALAWRFGELHGVEIVTGTFEELRDQGYFSSSISAPTPAEGEEPPAGVYQWEDGCLFTISPSGGHEDETYSLPTLFFDAEKWRSPLGAYFFADSSCVWPEAGTWSGYTVKWEAIS